MASSIRGMGMMYELSTVPTREAFSSEAMLVLAVVESVRFNHQTVKNSGGYLITFKKHLREARLFLDDTSDMLSAILIGSAVWR